MSVAKRSDKFLNPINAWKIPKIYDNEIVACALPFLKRDVHGFC
jgi:hypothetical protein